MASRAFAQAGAYNSERQAGQVALAAVLLLAGLLRLTDLGSTSLWSDELFTAFYPHTGLAHLWGEGFRTEPTSPLYYTLIWGVEQVAGRSAFALRMPSVLGSLAGIWIAGRLADELDPTARAPALAMLLLALSTTNLFYAQEARAYALQGAALALALLGFARFLRGDANGLWLYLVGAALALWLHPTSFIAVAAINAAALLSTVGAGRLLDSRLLLRWIVANVVLALAAAPLLPALLSSTGGAATAWIPHINRWRLEMLLGETLAGPALRQIAIRVTEIALPLLALTLLVPPWKPSRRAATVLLLVPGLFIALMIGVSVAKPVLLDRTLAWTLIPLAVVLGNVLARRNQTLAACVLAACVVALGLHFARIDRLKEDWQGVLAGMPDLAPPTLIVLSPHTSPGVLSVYAPNAGVPVRLDDGGPPMPETSLPGLVFGTETISRAALAAAIAAGRPVWLLYRRPECAWMLKITAGLPPPVRTAQDTEGSDPNIRALFW